MKSVLVFAGALVAAVQGTILQNGQVRNETFPDTTIAPILSRSRQWRTYGANASEISWKGRWDDKHISWWAAPGLKFGFTGSNVAISFGQYTSPGVLIGYRFAGQDWQFTNVTANSTHQLVSPSTVGLNLTDGRLGQIQTFEMHVSNWAYGVQVNAIHVDLNGTIFRIPDYGRRIEFIGDSLTAGMYDTYETMAGWAWNLGEGLGQTEFSITAYPGICLTDQNCWGNPRGQSYLWYRIPDTSWRAQQLYGLNLENAPMYDFSSTPQADLVIINIGTNDNNTHNNVTNENYYNSYISLVEGVHSKYPKAQIIIQSLWEGFGQIGNTWAQGGGFIDEIKAVYEHFKPQGFIHYFNTTGILQHNDIGPQYHPTDIGQIKVATHLMQYIKIKFGWDLLATGPEVQHNTLYWNDDQNA